MEVCKRFRNARRSDFLCHRLNTPPANVKNFRRHFLRFIGEISRLGARNSIDRSPQLLQNAFHSGIGIACPASQPSLPMLGNRHGEDYHPFH
jgi:hypothetical protein